MEEEEESDDFEVNFSDDDVAPSTNSDVIQVIVSLFCGMYRNIYSYSFGRTMSVNRLLSTMIFGHHVLRILIKRRKGWKT